MPLHEKAVYEDENKNWVTVTYQELISSTAQFRAKLRDSTLYDSTQCRKELGIRDRKGNLHYYQKKNFRISLDGKSKDSSAHDGQVKALTSFLNNNEKIVIGHYVFDSGEKIFQPIIHLKNFSWQKEVTFSISESGYMRCDILGRSNDFCWSEKSPYVALEVVDTHFSSKETFIALMELSKNLPVIIGYYFLKESGKFNNMGNSSRSNGYSKLRLSCYILDGGFWILDDRLNDHLDNPDDWNVLYEYVYEKIKKKYKN
jgi:hypothetical protein